MDLRAKIEAGRQMLRTGVQPVAAPDLFPTPDHVADRVAAALDLKSNETSHHCRVLEPSAGTGALLRAIKRADPLARVVAMELNRDLAEANAAECADFLQLNPDARPKFDRVAMNPPFSRGADIKHVRHALRFLKPGGVLVAIVADGPRQEVEFAGWDDVERLPSGTFAGTMVRARIIRGPA